MNNKTEKAAIFFPKTMRAEGHVYTGGKTYLLVKTAGTVDRWLKRGCQMGDPKEALDDPRLKEAKKVEEQKVNVPKPEKTQSRKPRTKTDKDTKETK